MNDLEFDPAHRPPTYWLYGDTPQQVMAVGYRLDRRTKRNVLLQVVAEPQGDDPDDLRRFTRVTSALYEDMEA